MDAHAVLDVGCGTGSMVRRARELGHRGRLVGLDPDLAALDGARRRTDVEWVDGVAADAAWDREFDLATMTGNAFQCLVSDEDLADSLAAVRRALRDGGRFVFDTRNPQMREWEEWNPSNATEVVDGTGRTFRVSHHVESVIGDVVTLTETTSTPDGTVLRVDRASLRFLDVPALGTFLNGAGFEVEAHDSGGHHGPVSGAGRSIGTIARRV
ncbi:class I SAM-dependent methyltransferase [Nonomuraea diastatica]|uniref:Class I SAM-dependent methyltransferase n=1 Tax=Nonomuraea diastatica TaxID=1848329 RepID=A0A4V2YCV3_9ACTN|nr:class I SAM-dependent methyltransferase [Nonomuraea diastatica]TDD12956.1 class I SAM-dependent methyltransferase [Nonomuraea diastatica]